MATRTQRQPFSPLGEFIAGKRFRFSGRDYHPGDIFPAKRLAVSDRKLLVLWEGRYITHKNDEVLGPEPDVQEELNEDPIEENLEEQGEELEETSEEENFGEMFTFDPEIHSIDNPERGQWFIKQGKETLYEISAKLGKKLRKAEEPVEVRV